MTGEKDTGWIADQEPPAAYMNWLQYWQYKWCQYLDGIEAEALNFTAGVTFTGVTSTPGATGTAAAHASGVGLQGFSSGTSGSVGVWGVGTAAGTRGLKVTHSIASEYMAAFLSTGSSTTLVNGIEIDAVYGGKAIDAATTKAALSGTATYAIKGYVEDSGTAATKHDYGIYGTGGAFLSSGVLGVSGSASGENYGVRGMGGNALSYGVYASGFDGGATGGVGLFVEGGEGTSNAGIGVDILGGTGVTNGNGGMGLSVSGGAGGSGTGNGGVGLSVVGGAATGGDAGAGLVVEPGISSGGAPADAIQTNETGGFTAADSVYGLSLAVGHEIKFRGTRTTYAATDVLPNVVTAGAIVNARANFAANTVGLITHTGRNVASVTTSGGGVYFRVTFSAPFSNNAYGVFYSCNGVDKNLFTVDKQLSYVDFGIYDTDGAGTLVNADSLNSSNLFDVMVVGEMA
jgi:hypothetical protein